MAARQQRVFCDSPSQGPAASQCKNAVVVGTFHRGGLPDFVRFDCHRNSWHRDGKLMCKESKMEGWYSLSRGLVLVARSKNPFFKIAMKPKLEACPYD